MNKQNFSKANRQALLNKLLKEELEELRLIFFPWKRKPFLNFKTEIKEKSFYKDKDLADVAGMYEQDEKNKKHIIYVDKKQILNTQQNDKKRYYRILKQVIKHELIHAFVKEKWENKYTNIKNKNRDASLIFLAILYWCNGITTHDCYLGWEQTELYLKIIYGHFKKYKELEEYLNNYLLDCSLVINQIKKISNKEEWKDKANKNFYLIINNFEFALRDNGLKKKTEYDWTDIILNKENKYIKVHNITRTWEIGCNVNPKQLLMLYKRKYNCKPKYFNIKKQLVIQKTGKTFILKQKNNI